jgi:hypothetical protein
LIISNLVLTGIIGILQVVQSYQITCTNGNSACGCVKARKPDDDELPEAHLDSLAQRISANLSQRDLSGGVQAGELQEAPIETIISTD